jgi:hypothetical protein
MLEQLEASRKKLREIRLILYSPHQGQLVFHNSRARFKIMTCGRRWGKTLAAGNDMVKRVCDRPRSLGWWVTPTYKIGNRGWKLLTRALSGVIAPGGIRRGERTIELANGSLIEFRSADNPDALRGEGVNHLVVDEAAMIPREAWEEALRPTLSDTKGSAVLISTPKGRNFFFELFCRGNDPEYDGWESFTFPTSSNPYIDPEEIEEARKTLPLDVFRQEYEAQFLEDSAGVFRGMAECIRGDLEDPVRGREYVLGWDPAKYEDFSVFTVMDEERRHVVAWDRFNGIDYSLQVERLGVWHRKYNNARIIMDSTGAGDPLLENVKKHVTRRVEGYTFTSTSKQQLIEHLAVAVQEGSVSFPKDLAVLRHELELYQYEITRAGNIRYSAPEGYHDDAVVSLALATWGCRKIRVHGPVRKPRGY